MKRLLLTIGLTLLFSFTALGSAHAQQPDPLIFIKSELGQADIQVIDFGSPENKWGSLSLEWIGVLTEAGYNSLQDVAEDYEDEFEGSEGLNELRYQKAVLEAQQSQLPTQAQRDELNQQIILLNQDIQDLEQSVKGSLNGIVGDGGIGFSDGGIDQKQALINSMTNQIVGLNLQIDELNQQIDDLGAGKLSQKNELRKDIKALEDQIEDLAASIADAKVSQASQAEGMSGVNLVFNELEFYFSAAKWGGLPYSIVRSLQDEQYTSLKIMAVDYLSLGQSEALETLQSDLLGLPYTNAEGDELELNEADIDIIYNAVVATQFTGEQQLSQVVQTIIRLIRNIVGGLAILWMVIAGIRMTLAQGDETVITEQKRTILYVFLGLAAILLMEQLVNILYGPPGQFQTSLNENRAFDAEIYGIISFIRAIIGVIAVAILVRSGIKAMVAQGQDDEIAKQRTSVAWVIAGLIVIAINKVIVENIFIGPTTQDDQLTTEGIGNIIEVFGNVLRFGLGFVGLIALAILVYGGGMMIANYGNEELVNKAKTLIKNAIIGIMVIIAAFTIVSTLVSFG